MGPLRSRKCVESDSDLGMELVSHTDAPHTHLMCDRRRTMSGLVSINDSMAEMYCRSPGEGLGMTAVQYRRLHEITTG